MKTVTAGEGIWLVHKPIGISSFGLVGRVRRLTGVRKVGHAGTLDPRATGLMIVLVGKDYTALADKFLKLNKTYEVQMTLGKTSSTGDSEGELIDVSSRQPTKHEVEQVLEQFVGQISQTPPIYSAIKINGQRAYKLARAGKKVEMPARTVTVFNLRIHSYDYPLVQFAVDVSSGTYIRSLVEDIGATLRTGAYMSGLQRTQIGPYSLSDAQVLE